MMATPKQIGYIESLLQDREVPETLAFTTTMILRKPELTTGKASDLIDSLLKLPRRPKDELSASTVPAARVDKYAHLRDIPKSYYALTWEQLHDAGVADVTKGNEIVFFRVNPWKDRVYLDKLSGNWGGFTKLKLSATQEHAVAGAILKDPAAAGKLFFDAYSRCARCGAELTEDDSRDTGYGPTCRGYMGL